jgi:acyl-coenzyme A thioesterase PaaI-like protein
MFIPQNPNFKELILEKLNGQHFMHHIGFELTSIEPGEVKGEMQIEEYIKQQTGFILLLLIWLWDLQHIH